MHACINGAEIYTMFVGIHSYLCRTRICRADENRPSEFGAHDQELGNGSVGDQHSALSADHEEHQIENLFVFVCGDRC